eukprot:3277485-Pyramimonas_sp.AAC.1
MAQIRGYMAQIRGYMAEIRAYMAEIRALTVEGGCGRSCRLERLNRGGQVLNGVVERLLETLEILNDVTRSAKAHGWKNCVDMRKRCIGGLSVMVVDDRGRKALWALQPGGETLLRLARVTGA